MVSLYFSDKHQQWTDADFFAYLQRVPQRMSEQILKYKQWRDRKNALCGKLLLINAFEDFRQGYSGIDYLEYSAHHRPFVSDETFMDFNITHSHAIAACVFSDSTRVGVDIEKIEDIPIKDFENQFTEKERRIIYSSNPPLKAFYYFWTRKESVVKADGRGLSLPLPEFDVCENTVTVKGLNWYLESVSVNEDYVLHIAGDRKIGQIKLIPCDFSLN